MHPGQVRIIGGKWRGRRLPIAHVEGLRPTPDRVRETLFNWLSSLLPGANCLDLFAGTGVLGFEAYSRGAKSVVLVDQSPIVVKQLRQIQTTLDVNAIRIHQAAVPDQLPKATEPYDIVFLDPPYTANVLFSTCTFLENNHYLANPAYIYLEANAVIQDNDLPTNWRLLKSQKAGAVFYHLAKRELNAV